MRISAAAIATAILMLAGCGPPSDDTAPGNITADNAAGNRIAPGGGASGQTPSQAPDQVSSEVMLQPGQWDITAALGTMDMPGAPPNVAAKLAQHNADIARGSIPARRLSVCLTPKEAANSAGNMLLGTNGATCHYENYVLNAGRLDATLVCDQPPSGTRTTLSGTMSATAYELDMVMSIPDTSGKVMTVRASTKANRTGECAG